MRPLSMILVLCSATFLPACPQTDDGGDARPDPAPRPVEPVAPTKAEPDSPPIRLLVVPFESRTVPMSSKAYTFALAAMLAERLENDPAVEVLNGPLVLTAEQAHLLNADGSATAEAILASSTADAEGNLTLKNPNAATYEPRAFLKLAKSVGATHVLAGRLSGPIWDCEIAGELWRIETKRGEDGATETVKTLAAHRVIKADWTVLGKTRSGRNAQFTNAAKMHESFADAIVQTLAAAKIRLDPATVEAVRTPSTRDAYALLMLSRAYSALFFADDPNPVKNADRAIKAAAHAMSIDPRHYEAQRLYGQLLYEGGNPLAARAHFEAAVKVNPNDVRSLVRLGVIETAERNVLTARDYLERAAKLRPADADIAFWLGRAALANRDKRAATSEFERARMLDPDHADARRELATLYSFERRYADAATELREVLRVAPRDRDSHFLYGACLRADGRIMEAANAYENASKLFPANPTFLKFLGDMLTAAGDTRGAHKAYWDARWMNFFDRRISRILGKPIIAAPQIGADELLKAVRDAYPLRAQISQHRSVFYLGMNDAILDLVQNGQEACLDGHGASSALTAVQAREQFDALQHQQSALASRIATAREFNEWLAFTPDERQAADDVLAAAAASRQDAREMSSQFSRAFQPLYVTNHCHEYDGEITPATVSSILARHRSRLVTMPEARRVPMLPIAPDVPAERALIISFRIDNTEGRSERAIVLDGNLVATVPPGATRNIQTTVGPHDLCVQPDAALCSRPENVSNIYLHNGYTRRIRPGN